MMKHEFEALAGYEVSFEDYNRVIEPMYTATELSKEDFVKCIDRKRFALPTKAELLAAMRKEAKHLYDICGRCCDFESEQRLERLAHTYLKRVYGVDWTVDSQAYAFFLKGYEYPTSSGVAPIRESLCWVGGNREYERIALVKKCRLSVVRADLSAERGERKEHERH